MHDGERDRLPAGPDRPAECRAFVYWWDGEYEGNCELQPDHGPLPHFDGLSWFNDDNEPVHPEPGPPALR